MRWWPGISRKRSGGKKKPDSLRVLYITPFYFDAASVIGGAERYALELARAMSEKHETVLLSFSENARREKRGHLTCEYVSSPLSPAFFRAIFQADIVHCHQVLYPQTDIALLAGKFLGKKVFLTDLGGSSKYSLSYHLPLMNMADSFLLISAYSKKLWVESRAHLRERCRVIYGGVDTEKFRPSAVLRTQKVLFVGRIVSNKGIEVLIDALDENMQLDVVGKVYDHEYFEFLKKRAIGKKVSFIQDVKDGDLARMYQEAGVLVQPSVYRDYRGVVINIPELLGLASLEAMACETPVIVTDAASLPELLEDGVSGFVVPPNDPLAIRNKIMYVLSRPDEARAMGMRARQRVLEKFTWQKTADLCLEAYQ